MEDATTRTALVTGANSGLGFETAARLAEEGWSKVILACRSIEKAEAARRQLVERTGKDPYDTLAIDTSEVASAQKAAGDLKVKGARIDFLLLNAGASKKEPTFNSSGVEITYASTLVGHHVLTMKALEMGLLSDHARIVIAGSEGARGNMPGMGVHDVQEIANEAFDGNVADALQAFMRLEVPSQTKSFANMKEYVTAKLIVAWWVGALAKKLPDGITVNAVSPGAVLETSFGRDAPAAMRYIMMPVMKLLGPVMAMNGPIEDGVSRYVAAADYTDDQSGHFYATAHRRKLVGPVGVQTWPETLIDPALQEAGLQAMVQLTAVDLPAGLRDSA